MNRMHNPAHPGEVLREYPGDITVTSAAQKLGVTRVALSRILNGTNGISADMALRLEDALGTSAMMRAEMQVRYDLWKASQKKRPKIRRIHLSTT
ncbi:MULTISPECIES: HigA family addiction module antitoxin [unclassified Dyella]|jgi:addiction module HigA family antidote|uniref:HigA family addiction module antitoxin n=1 Tax=unclassified Dyella TaxID=2634549 RepID=UPI003F9096D0